MSRSIALLALGIIGAFVFSLETAAAQQFSADLVGTGPAARPLGKLQVADGKVRIETRDVPDGVFLVDGRADAAFFLQPARKTFMAARQSSPLTWILVPVDPDDPCRQWQAMAADAGMEGRWRCEKLGSETVEGRRAIKYRVTSPRGAPGVAWIDPELRFPLRFEGATAVAVTNIEAGPQPTALFEIPADFHKFDPERLIERIKQSDVWVEPPK